MAIWLGILCVGWTLFEIGRLAASSRPAVVRTGTSVKPRQSGSARPEKTSFRQRPMAAWDELGRRIDVEDLGHP